MNKVKQTLKAWFIPGTENDYKPHILKNKTILVFAIFVLCFKLLVFGFFFYFPKSAYFSAITSNRLVDLVNETRAENGLSPLQVNDKLGQSAFFKASDMIEKDYFAHTSSQGLTPWYWFKQAHYNYRYAGENLAIDFTDAETLFKAWLDSPTHKANILSPKYEEIGIAILTGDFDGHKTTVAVQHFGVPFERPIEYAKKETTPKQENPPASPPLAELEEKDLASARETEEEPILTPEEKQIEDSSLAIIEERIRDFEKFATDIQTNQGSKILGVLAEKSDEINQRVLTYALLFVVLALLLNVFIKIEVQDRKSIINGLLIIAFMIILVLIGDKYLLNAGLNII